MSKVVYMYLMSILTSLYVVSCGEEENDGLDSVQGRDQIETREEKNSETDNFKPLNVCSFDTTSNRGCLKATISATNLRFGPFNYLNGFQDVSRKFTKDLIEAKYIRLDEGDSLKILEKYTVNSFYSNFYIIAESTASNHRANANFDGNLTLNNLVPGTYQVLLYQEINLRSEDSEGNLKNYYCAVISTIYDALVVADRESILDQQVRSFDLEIDNRSCEGYSPSF